jgi:hypothetical protein
MSEAFVVRNQLGQYWGKKKRWVDGSKAKRVMVCKHEDEGINLLVELGARDIELRGEVLACETNDRGIPRVEPSAHKLEDPDDLRPEPELVEEDAEAAEAAPDALENTGEDPISEQETDSEIHG